LESAAKAYAEEHPQTSYIVMGHYHIAIDEPVTPLCRLIVLGDWISKDTYAVFDGNTLQLKHYEPQQH
ncbi:MAG: UDP-2,3-diacylglucosamine diphosphatase, partial [Muribaculaceae bacterium]|nr:UDP-2,3-diacylglucosamine diphosphatase [Muribaculaceae bacterium]